MWHLLQPPQPTTLEYNSAQHVLNRRPDRRPPAVEVGRRHSRVRGSRQPSPRGLAFLKDISETALGREMHQPAGLIDGELKMNEAGQLS